MFGGCAVAALQGPRGEAARFCFSSRPPIFTPASLSRSSPSPYNAPDRHLSSLLHSLPRRSRCTPLSFPSLSSPRSPSRELSQTSPSLPPRSLPCAPSRPSFILRILTTSPLQCGSVKLTWDSTGASSYNVAIVPTDDPCNEILCVPSADQGTKTLMLTRSLA